MLALTLTVFHPAPAQRTIRMNIERMVSDAAMIVHGTVAKVESAVDPQTNLLATIVTIDVLENIYGADQTSVTLKMVGGRTLRRTLRFADMPAFTVGEEVFSLFYRPSKYGFTSPVGMGQGKFTVRTDASTGKKLVRNAVNNARLFSGMKTNAAPAAASLAKTAAGGIEAAELSNTLRSLVTILKK